MSTTATNKGADTMTKAQISETITKTVNEFVRRAQQVGPEQALREAAEFHPGAAIMLADFFDFAKRGVNAERPGQESYEFRGMTDDGMARFVKPGHPATMSVGNGPWELI